MSIDYLASFHQRLSVTTTLVVLTTFGLYAYLWWQRRPEGLWQFVLIRIITLLLTSNIGIGIWITLQQRSVSSLHVIYAGVVLLPLIGVRVLKRFSPAESHAKHTCVALLIVLVILHRLAVTSH